MGPLQSALLSFLFLFSNSVESGSNEIRSEKLRSRNTISMANSRWKFESLNYMRGRNREGQQKKEVESNPLGR